MMFVNILFFKVYSKNVWYYYVRQLIEFACEMSQKKKKLFGSKYVDICLK